MQSRFCSCFLVNATENRIDRSTADTPERRRRQYWSNWGGRRGGLARGSSSTSSSSTAFCVCMQSVVPCYRTDREYYSRVLLLVVSCRDNPHFDRCCNKIRVFVYEYGPWWRWKAAAQRSNNSVLIISLYFRELSREPSRVQESVCASLKRRNAVNRSVYTCACNCLYINSWPQKARKFRNVCVAFHVRSVLLAHRRIF